MYICLNYIYIYFLKLSTIDDTRLKMISEIFLPTLKNLARCTGKTHPNPATANGCQGEAAPRTQSKYTV